MGHACWLRIISRAGTQMHPTITCTCTQNTVESACSSMLMTTRNACALRCISSRMGAPHAATLTTGLLLRALRRSPSSSHCVCQSVLRAPPHALQASLHALHGNAQLSLPGGKTQALDSVWSARGPAPPPPPCAPADADADAGAAGAEASTASVGVGSAGTASRQVDEEARQWLSQGRHGEAAGVGAAGAWSEEGGQVVGSARAGAQGGWLSGHAVRAHSARMQAAGMEMGPAGRPASAALRGVLRASSARLGSVRPGIARPGTAAAAGVKGGTAGALRGGNAPARLAAGSAHAPLVRRPASAAVHMEGAAAGGRLARARPMSAMPGAGGGRGPPAQAARPAHPHPPDEAGGAAAIAVAAAEAGAGGPLRPGSAMGAQRQGRGWRLAQMNAAQVRDSLWVCCVCARCKACNE